MDKDKNLNRTKNILRNICIATIILFLGIIMIFKSFKVEKGLQNLLYSYNINRSLNYKVNLKENDFFDSQTMDMNETYISSLVDKINMDYSYSYSGNKKGNTKYTYQIVAVTNVNYDSLNNEEKNKTIWSKQYVLVPQKELNVDSSNFSINENFDVDFATYNDEVKKFKEQLRVPINADLQVKMIVISNSDIPGIEKKVVENSIVNVKIDLAEDVFSIEKQFENNETKNVIDSNEDKKEINKPLLIMGSIFVLASILIILDAIRKSIKFSKKTDYAIALNRILKNYGDIVAEIVSPVEIDNLNVIEVKNFDQLLDIEEEIRMPILFYETIPDEQGEFIIVCDNMAYRYVIG